MKDISYRIISCDPKAVDLAIIAKKTVIEFLQLVGLRLTPEIIECKGCVELENEWAKLGKYEDATSASFVGQLASIYEKATGKPLSLKIEKAILVTDKDIGEIVGVSYDRQSLAIISSYQVPNDINTVATAVFHELGHMHNIPSLERGKIGPYSLRCIDDDKIVAMENDGKNKDAIYFIKGLGGEHCLNPGCSMRQRLCFINWKKHLTAERSPDKPYCDRCLNDLKI
jgi:hypothetical protein